MNSAFDRYRDRLAGRTFLLLGGTGFFGQALVEGLTATLSAHGLDARVVVTTRDATRTRHASACFSHPAVSLIEADFLHQDALPQMVKADYILHLATTSARDTHARVAQASKYELLVNATRAVCRQVADHPPARVLFTSSGVIYGPEMPEGGFRETTPISIDHLTPASSLAMGKLAAEYMLAASCDAHAVPLSIARCFTFVGPTLPTDLHYAIGNFVRDAAAGQPITIRGDGLDVRSYMHLLDAVAWLCHLLFEPDAPRVMNVGSPEPLSIADLARRVAETVNPGSPVHILGQPPAGDNYRRRAYWPNVELAQSRGLTLTRDLAGSLTELARALRDR